MIRTMPWKRAAVATAGVLCALTWASRLSAQTFFLVGAGSNILSRTADHVGARPGLNFNLSVGTDLTPGVQIRLDGMAMTYANKIAPAQPCPTSGCSGPPQYDYPGGSILGASVTGQMDLAPQGRAYLLAGLGIYANSYYGRSTNGGVLAGAGFTVPVRPDFDLYAEARWLGLSRMGTSGDTKGMNWIVPITVGMRVHVPAPE